MTWDTRRELELQQHAAQLRVELRHVEDELYSPAFGWTREEPPSAGVIETRGFEAKSLDALGFPVFTRVMAGVVDAAAYNVPGGTLWRHT